MTDLVNRCSVTWRSGAYPQASQGGISGTEIDTGTVFFTSTSVLTCDCHHTSNTHSFIHSVCVFRRPTRCSSLFNRILSLHLQIHGLYQ